MGEGANQPERNHGGVSLTNAGRRLRDVTEIGVLYHFTSEYHWPRILATGEIVSLATLVDLGLSTAPPVTSDADAVVDSLIWLTSDPSPRQPWQNGSVVDKSAIRITIDQYLVCGWREFAHHLKIPEDYLARLRRGGNNDGRWFISTEAIPSAGWRTVERTRTHQVLWKRQALSPLR